MPIVTPYEDLLRLVLATGSAKSDRTGTGTRSLFGQQLRYDLSVGFPLLTTKKVHLKSVVYELLWFLRGDSNVAWLQSTASPSGTNGPAAQAISDRSTGCSGDPGRHPSGEHIDQISAALDLLRTDPNSRRIIVSAWNVGEIPQMALPPCHAIFQFYVADGRLSCQLYQRSADLFLGCAVQHRQLRAAHAHDGRPGRLAVGEFVWTGGDCHIYDNHVEQVREQLAASRGRIRNLF